MRTQIFTQNSDSHANFAKYAHEPVKIAHEKPIFLLYVTKQLFTYTVKSIQYLQRRDIRNVDPTIS